MDCKYFIYEVLKIYDTVGFIVILWIWWFSNCQCLCICSFWSHQFTIPLPPQAWGLLSINRYSYRSGFLWLFWNNQCLQGEGGSLFVDFMTCPSPRHHVSTNVKQSNESSYVLMQKNSYLWTSNILIIHEHWSQQIRIIQR